jgi:tRNA(fMet)-specific endonuclease VapC
MIWLLDTDTVGHLINAAPGSEHIKRRLSGRSPGELRLSAISWVEIRCGIEAGDIAIERREALDDFLGLFQVDDFPAGAAEDYAEIRVALERKGKKIGGYDLLIAAHARHINATLVTGNEREFRRVPGLIVQNWRKV